MTRREAMVRLRLVHRTAALRDPARRLLTVVLEELATSPSDREPR
jgi:hypothetical protein